MKLDMQKYYEYLNHGENMYMWVDKHTLEITIVDGIGNSITRTLAIIIIETAFTDIIALEIPEMLIDLRGKGNE